VELNPLLDKCLHTGDLTRDEIIFLLSLEDEADIKRLLDTADEVRKANIGEGVHIRGLIEFSNFCARECCYCGIRSENENINRYRMPPQEIVDVALGVVEKGIQTIVLQSGEDPWYSAEMIANTVWTIKSQADCAVTLCVGERSKEEYQIMKDSGADRYLLRHETANPELFRVIHPDGDYDHRMQCLQWLKEVGFQVGAGSMVGIPGQTIGDMADDVIFVRDIEADMVGIGPFIPHPDTPFGNEPGGALDMTLKMVAVTRIATRNAHMPATTAIGSIDELGREKALMAGADVVMPNYTPLKYRIDYEIYPNKRCITEDPALCDGCMRMRITSIGREVATGKGHSLKTKLDE